MSATGKIDEMGELLKEVAEGVNAVAEEMRAFWTELKKDFKEIKTEMIRTGMITGDLESEGLQCDQQREMGATPEKDPGDSEQTQEDDEREEAGLKSLKTKTKMASGTRSGKENIQRYFQKKKYDEVQGMYNKRNDIRSPRIEKEQRETGVKGWKYERKRVRKDSEKEDERGGCSVKGGDFRKKKKRDEG